MVWLDQPIRYRETGLTSGLVDDLDAWEQSYYDSLTDDIEWVSLAAARAYTVEGTRLAHRVAAEVGPRFVVEFASYEDAADTVRVRSEHPTENPEAEKAFTKLFDEIDAEDREAAKVRSSPDGETIAYAPMSNTVFNPNSNLQTEAGPDTE
ncbi:hypothetical protein CV023_02730 [Brevibacterium sp. CCUG 69071]|nr:hypothetical protein [Brevibacterium sp. CCUG 69071]